MATFAAAGDGPRGSAAMGTRRHERSAAVGEQAQAQVRAAALAYAGRGWAVIPMARHGKRPLVEWREFEERRATPKEISDWFDRWPDANVGVVTGRISGIVVVDVDSQHGGLESLAGARAQGMVLPVTVAALTGGGGEHHYYAHPGGRLSNRVGLRPGIDLRADGGCVVAPPSLHSSGRRYAWMAGRSPDECALAPLPDWLYAADPAVKAGRGTEHWRTLVREGVGEGARNSTVASLTGHLLWHGVDEEVALELMLCWNRARCRPPLDDQEVARVVDSIARTHRRGDPAPD